MKIKMPNLTAEEVDQKIAAAVADWHQQLDALVEEKVAEALAKEKKATALWERKPALWGSRYPPPHGVQVRSLRME